MQVFVEYLIIDNFIFDYLLLLLTAHKSKDEIKKKKIVLASLVGTAVAVVFPLIKLQEFLLFLLKIFTAFIIVALAFGVSDCKRYFSLLCKFVILTFLFGGSIYAIMSLFGISYTFLYGTTNAILPLGFLIICAIALYGAVKFIINKIFVKKVIYSYSCSCTLFWGENKIFIKGYFDSGNHVQHKNKSVCFSGQLLNNKLLSSGFFNERPLGELEIYTVSGSKKTKVYQFDKLEIYFNNKKNIIYKPTVAIGDCSFNAQNDYDLILPCDYLVDSEV